MLSATGPSPTGTSTTWSWTYDGQGNRLSESDGTVSTTYATDNQGWPVTADRSVGNDLTFTHDADGNLVGLDEAGGTAHDLTFGYDSWSGTSSASKGGTSVNYTLDAFGRTSARGSVAYNYQGASEDLVRTDASGTITEYLSTPGGPMATKSGSTTSFFLRDLHGDVVGQIAPGAGSLSATAYFSPYGERSTLSGSLGLYGYQGDVTDQLTGTVDMLTRNYLPSVGRFTSRDVLQGDPNDPPSLNQFVYATGNPVTFWDPLGLCANPDICPDVESDGDGGIQQTGENPMPEEHQERDEDYYSSDGYLFWSIVARPDIAVFLIEDEQQFHDALARLNGQKAKNLEDMERLQELQALRQAAWVRAFGQLSEHPLEGCGALAFKCVDISAQVFMLRAGWHSSGGPHLGYGLGSGGSVSLRKPPSERLSTQVEACYFVCAGTSISSDPLGGKFPDLGGEASVSFGLGIGGGASVEWYPNLPQQM